MLQIKSFTFNAFEENTYVLYDETHQGIVVDPGCYEKHEEQALIDFVSKSSLVITQVVNTHCHIDHVLGNHSVKTRFKVPLLVPALEVDVLRSVSVYAPSYGFPQYQEAQPDTLLQETDKLTFGAISLDILFIPGHSPGHLGFYDPQSKILMGGDVLFYRSVGRTDLPGGNTETLLESIHKILFNLPDDVTVLPGHGPSTTIGEEKIYNPFCALTV